MAKGHTFNPKPGYRNRGGDLEDTRSDDVPGNEIKFKNVTHAKRAMASADKKGTAEESAAVRKAAYAAHPQLKHT